jgi:hypothetical protein
MSRTRQTTPAFTNRPCPPYKSKDYPGQTLRGNDGNMWVSTQLSGSGSYRWVRRGANRARQIKEAKKIESFKKHLRESFVRLKGQQLVIMGINDKMGLNAVRDSMIMLDNGNPKQVMDYGIVPLDAKNKWVYVKVWDNVFEHPIPRDHLKSLEDPMLDDYIRREGMPFIQKLMKTAADWVNSYLVGHRTRHQSRRRNDRGRLNDLIRNAEDDDLSYFRRLVATHAMFLKIKELFEAGLLEQDIDEPDNRPHSAFFPGKGYPPGYFSRLDPVRHGLGRRKPRG